MRYYLQPTLCPWLIIFLMSLTGMLDSRAHGDYHDLVRKLENQLAGSPGDTKILYSLVIAHLSHQEWQRSLEPIKKLESLAPHKYPVAYLRGWSWNLGGKHARALSSLEMFIKEHPNHPQALYQKGVALRNLKQAAEAITAFEAAIQNAKPQVVEHHLQLIDTLARDGQSLAASRAVDRGLTALGNTPQLLHIGLSLELESKQWAKALERIDALQKFAPSPGPWMLRRAETLKLSGRQKEAHAEWKRLLDHLTSLPSLEKETYQNRQLRKAATTALGISKPDPVLIPPTAPKK